MRHYDIEGAYDLFYHVDGLGSVRELTNSQGAIAQSYAYDSFGQIVYMKYPYPIFGQPYTYTGREFDPESGLYYYRARYYDPSIGRFLQEDPLFLASINAYSYVANNPINLTDSLGLLPRKIGFLSNPAWTQTRDRVKQELSSRFGNRFSEQELNFAAEKFANEVSLRELSRLRDKDTQGQTLQDIGQRIKEEIDKTGSPQEKDLAKRLEEAIKEEIVKEKGDIPCP